MKRKLIALATSILIATSLVGCSSGSLPKVENGSIVLNGKALDSTEYTGSRSVIDLPGMGDIQFYWCDRMEDCDHNSAGVLVDDMSDYKNAKYYQLYLGTQVYMYYPIKEGFIESHSSIEDPSMMSVEQMVNIMYNESEKLTLSSEIQKINFEGVTVNLNSNSFKLRKTELVIPGLLRVKKDDGSVTFEQQQQITEELLLPKMSSTKYDYYSYNGCIIQAALGTDITQYIEFK